MSDRHRADSGIIPKNENRLSIRSTDEQPVLCHYRPILLNNG